MRISGKDGQWISLTPSGYQFPNLDREKWNGWDENWLQIAGDVSYDGGRHWSFRDAGLTASEAMLIAPWLRRAASGSIAVSAPDSEGWVAPDLVFVEPNLAFSIAERSGNSVQLRVHFSLESAPPWLDTEERASIWSFFVQVEVSSTDLEVAAAEWEAELRPYPDRGLR